jgi:aspartate racemase
MKTIGLIGGMSWESSAVYYRLINQEVQKRLGGVHSAKIVMVSFDFAELEELQRAGRWDDATKLMVDTGRTLARAGAELLLICTNTMHRMADEVEQGAGVPLLHICDPAARKAKAEGLSRVALLGTAYTMEQSFYKDRLRAHGLDVIVPDEADRAVVHRVIYEELVCGKIEQASRKACREIIARLVAQGAQGVILGCTELPLLIKPEDSAVPLFDTTTLHALAAVDLALA